MKQSVFSTLVYSVAIGSLVLLGSGCSKKSVVPPVSSPSASSGGMSSGNDINYPPAEYSETSIEGTLDDGGLMAGSDGQNLMVDGSMDSSSKEYLMTRGRSSENLSPIYYNFDQFTIRADMVDRMIANADYIQQSGIRIIIEGNCDERGTNEYNLALGEKRALSAKQYLVDLGVNENVLRTVSYGEERPLFTEQDEFSYEQNRRTDFVAE